MPITYHPIGVIHTPFRTLEGMPIQPTGEGRAAGTVVLDAAFADGVRDLEGFSHVILIYHLHAAGPSRLTVTPFLDESSHGVFATRAPARPNPIGLSIVELVEVRGHVLHVANLDVLDGTPLLDIKPYVPAFDAPAHVRTGWLEAHGADVVRTRADDRFVRRAADPAEREKER